jgi:uncharacterized membrane-anchored protein
LSVSILSISFLIKWIGTRAILTSDPVVRSLISAIPNPIKKQDYVCENRRKLGYLNAAVLLGVLVGLAAATFYLFRAKNVLCF